MLPAPRVTSLSLLIVLSACTKRDAPLNDTTVALAPAPSDSTTSTASSTPTSATPVRGTVKSLSDTALTISTATGEVHVHITPPLNVYTRTPSDLAQVTPTAFFSWESV